MPLPPVCAALMPLPCPYTCPYTCCTHHSPLGMHLCHPSPAAPPAGELAIKCSSDELRPIALPALEQLALILQVPTGALPRSLVENAAITLGRIAWMCPEPLAPHAAAFLGPWCAALRGIRDDIEKEHAFLGLCAVLRLNPQARSSEGRPFTCVASLG